jgi:REP-associated tyrosine transposase
MRSEGTLWSTEIMPQSLANIIIHLVFSTKNRREWIISDLEKQLYAYLQGIANNIKTPIIEIGGMPDHIHMLINLPRTLALSEAVQQLKIGSSRFIKEKEPSRASDFAWQKGYGGFSVSPSLKQTVIEYIRAQKEHHLNRSFQDEYRALLTKHEIIFDEKYVWD